MFCRQCGTKIENDSATKCPNCSARLGKGRRFCPECGTANKYNKNFCDDCGFDFTRVEIKKSDETVANLGNETESDKKTGNSLAEKIMKANEGQSNPFANYGKPPVKNPLKMATPNNEKKIRSDNFSVNTPMYEDAQEDESDFDIENEDSQETENIEKTKETPTFIKSRISTLSILVFILSFATLSTCQVVYGALALLLSVVESFKHKNYQPLIVAVVSIVAMFFAIYFGISFYQF